MSTYNSDDFSNLKNLLENVRDGIKDGIDKTKEEHAQQTDSTYADNQPSYAELEKIKADRAKVKRIIKIIVIAYALMTFGPFIVGFVMMAIGLVISIASELKLESGPGGLEEILPLPEDTSDSGSSINFGTSLKEFFNDINFDFKFEMPQLFSSDTNYALIILIALAVGIVLILILRAVTTKEDSNGQNTAQPPHITTVSDVQPETQVSEFADTNNDTDTTDI